MGITISGIVEIGRPLFPSLSPLTTTVAFIKATIDKTLLEGWLNLAELQANFPNRVDILGHNVSLKGPVLILPSRTAIIVLKIALPILFGILSGVLMYKACEKTQDIYFSKQSKSKDIEAEKAKIAKRSVALAGAGSLVAAGMVFYFVQGLLPSAPGIYFYK